MIRYLLVVLLSISCARKETLSQLKERFPSSYRELLDRDGIPLQEVRSNHKVDRRAWVELKDLPPELPAELTGLEDKRFRSHFGVDLLALSRALTQFPNRGASTITMQLVKILEGGKRNRSVSKKLKQIFKAIILETRYSKDEILEIYLNLIPFRGETQGLHAASRSIFGKHPRALNLQERVVLYSMIPSPNQTNKQLLERACRYLKKLGRPCGLIDPFGRPREEMANLAPHALKLTTSETTTLRREIQEHAIKSLHGQIRLLNHQNVKDGAVLVADHRTNEVLAYVGSSGTLSDAPHVDHVQSLRQAGSTLKPLLYAAAIKRKLITSATPIKDEPFTITRQGLTYQPENYQKAFTYKNVPARVALGSSLNIAAIKVIDLYGPDRFYHLLKQLEMRDLREEEFYGHSMALGAVDITLWDLVRAYSALANGGTFRELSISGPVAKSAKIEELSPEASSIIGRILANKENRYLTFSLNSTLSTDSWAAVKTGTSKDMRDNWCIGFTDKYVIGVWVGNSSGEPMWNVSGVSGAAPVFHDMVNFLHREHPSLEPKLHPGIIVQNGELYLKGTEPKSKTLEIRKPQVLKILFPQNGSQFAYDPEIPEKFQHIFFKTTVESPKLTLNNKFLTSKQLKTGFLPAKKGKYELELWDEKARRDSVIFHVKSGRL